MAGEVDAQGIVIMGYDPTTHKYVPIQVNAASIDTNNELYATLPTTGGAAGSQYTDGQAPPANPIGGALIFDSSGTWKDVGVDNPLPVTGGGGGTQYVDAAAPPANPTGTAIVYDNSGAWVDVGVDHALPTLDNNSAQIQTNTANIPAKGQATMANSTPVAIASNQSAVPISGTATANQGTGAAAGTSWRTSGDFTEVTGLTAAALNADLVASTDMSQYQWGILHINGAAYTGTISFQWCNDNVSGNFISQNAYNMVTDSAGGGVLTTGSTNVIYAILKKGRYFRARMTSYTSGTAGAVMEWYTTPPPLFLSTLFAAQSGTWTVQPGNTPNTTAWKVDPSAVTSPENLTQVAGVAIAVGNAAVPILATSPTGGVAAWGSNAAATTAATDYAFKWGGSGTTVVNHIMLQNNTAANIEWDLDTATSLGSPILAPGNTIFLDVQTTALHLQSAAIQNVNGSSAANIVVRAWL